MIVGISGVGKTTFAESLKSKLDFQHLTAGSLIAASLATPSSNRDSLRLANIEQNQDQLVRGLRIARDPEASLILLDGHVVIHTDDNLHKLGADVFKELGVQAFLHLVAAPEMIAKNRTGDECRNRPRLTITELGAHQETSLRLTKQISQSLGVPYKVFSYQDVDLAGDFLLSLVV